MTSKRERNGYIGQCRVRRIIPKGIVWKDQRKVGVRIVVEGQYLSRERR